MGPSSEYSLLPGHYLFANSVTKADIAALLILCGLLLIFYLISMARKSSRRKKDIYGFNLPEWKILNDQLKIQEIELDFKKGLIAVALNQTHFATHDSHSHLILKNGEDITGLVQLSIKKQKLSDLFLPFDRTQFSFTHVLVRIFCKSDGNRYFIGKTTNKLPNLVRINSASLVELKYYDLENIENELRELEELFGANNWSLIGYEHKFYILIPELFDLEKIRSFLKIAQEIQSKR